MAIQLFQEQAPFSNKRLSKPVSADGSYTNPVIAPFAFDFTTHVSTLECVIYVRNDSQEHYYKNIVMSLMKSDGTEGTLVTGNIVDDPLKGPSLSINGNIVPTNFSTETIPAIPVEGIPLVSRYMSDYTPIFSYEEIGKQLIGYYWITASDAVWDGTLFNKGAQDIDLNISGSWNYQYRPDEISIHFNSEANREWYLYDTAGNVIAGGPSIASGALVAIDWQYDLDISTFSSISAGDISDIKFYYSAVEDEKDNKSTVEETDTGIDIKFSYGYDELNEPDWDRAKSVLVIPTLGTINIPDTSYHPVRMRVIWKSRSPLLTVRDYFIDISYAEEVALGS